MGHMTEAAVLLQAAVNALAMGNAGGALWRAVDAAAILAADLPPDAIGGFHEPTGRGFLLACHEEQAP